MQGDDRPRREDAYDRLGLDRDDVGEPRGLEDLPEAGLELRAAELVDLHDPVLDRTPERVLEDRVARLRVDGLVAVALAARVGELDLEAAAARGLPAERVEPVAREQLRVELVLVEEGLVERALGRGGLSRHRCLRW